MSGKQQPNQQKSQKLEYRADIAVSKTVNQKIGRKRSKCGDDPFVAGAAGDSTVITEKKLLQTSMEQLQVSQKPITPITSRKAAGSNWNAVAIGNQHCRQKACEHENVTTKGQENCAEGVVLTKSARRRQKLRAAEQKYVAMDCEMVGVGTNGQDDMVARVSIVSKRGEVLLDKFVKPQEPVVDYRTSVSGIRPHDIINAEPFKNVQDEVVQILQDKILIGHAIRNDLAVLHIKHPQYNTRDTSRYKPLSRMVANGRTPSLKRLTQAILGKEIQTGEHNSVEDARAAMSIYNVLASDWEAYINRHTRKSGK